MANTVNKTVLEQGSRYVLLHVYLASDGVTGELVDEVLIDTSDLIPEMGAESLVIDEVWHELAGFNATLEFDSIVDDPVWTLTPSGKHHDFSKFGGLKDRSGFDSTGRLLLSTTGFDSTADQGAFVLRLRKR